MTEKLLKVICGQCDGKMRVRRAGEAVVCPHCSSHMRVPMNVKEGTRLESESGSGVLDRVASRSGPLKKSEAQTIAEPGSSAEKAGDSPAVSRNMFVAVASYASAVTLALLWLLLNGRSHQLESLPDVRTLGADELQFVGFDAALPAGHTLGLNESRRYGDIRITPLKVTREPITFAHYDTDSQTRPPTEPVLKLWLKFENVATDVAFPPFDAALMSRRAMVGTDRNQAKANSFLYRSGKPRTPENVILNYNHSIESEWDLDKQPNGSLAVGGTQTTFVATSEEGLARATSVPGELTWRVQFRKGINRETRRGVTTLVDVCFSTTEIEPG